MNNMNGETSHKKSTKTTITQKVNRDNNSNTEGVVSLEAEETTTQQDVRQHKPTLQACDVDRASRARQGCGVRQFPVERRRNMPVVDTGCGWRPSHLSLLSMLKFGSSHLNGWKAGMKSGGSWYLSSTSSSSCSSTHSSTDYSSAYSSTEYCYHGGAGAAATKKQEKQAPVGKKSKKQEKKKKREQENKMGDGEPGNGVGVAVEKDSCDPHRRLP
jgi:hypothetical protein